MTISRPHAILTPCENARQYTIQHKSVQEEDRLMAEEPVHVTDSAFESTVMQSSVPVIVDFWALVWSMPDGRPNFGQAGERAFRKAACCQSEHG
jgi:hypothetical protein